MTTAICRDRDDCWMLSGVIQQDGPRGRGISVCQVDVRLQRWCYIHLVQMLLNLPASSWYWRRSMPKEQSSPWLLQREGASGSHSVLIIILLGDAGFKLTYTKCIIPVVAEKSLGTFHPLWTFQSKSVKNKTCPHHYECARSEGRSPEPWRQVAWKTTKRWHTTDAAR